MARRLRWMTSLFLFACTSESPDVADGTTGTSTNGGGMAGTSSGGNAETLEPDTSGTATGGMAPCRSDDDCTDPSMRFCSPALQQCVDCTGVPDPDGACAGLDPASPACREDGVCVQCTATATSACQNSTPVCDIESNQCVVCTAHEQCGDAACNLFTGACLPQDAVLRVGPGREHTTLASAVATVPAAGQATVIVDEDYYNEAVTITGRTIAFLASPGAEPEWQRTTGADTPQLTISGGATVLMDGIKVGINNTSVGAPGIDLTGASLWMDRGRVVQGAGRAVRADDGNVVLRSSFLNGNNHWAVLDAQDSQVTVSFSTLVAAFGTSTALACDGASTVTVRDSIMLSYSADPEVACDVDAEHTATESALVGTGNQAVGDFLSEWFVFDLDGDYHLSLLGQNVFADIAEWNDGDPLFDIDGDPRSGVDGTPEHAGGDLP